MPVPVLLHSKVPADLVHLDGVNDQNTLLLRLRTAAATPGPLLVYLSGRLTVDRRGQFYLASTGTNTSTARYTALPWEWLYNELRSRPAERTTLLLDLAADKPAWAKLRELGSLPAVNADTYGIVSPPGVPGADGASPYTRQLVEQLRRTPDRPSASRLHALTVAAAGIPPGAMIMPTAPEIEALDEEQVGHRQPVTNLQRLLAGDTSFLPRRKEPSQAAPGLEAVQPASASPPPVQVRQQPPPQTRIHPTQPNYQHPQPPGTTPVTPQQSDPRPYIRQTAQAGRHREAAEMAAAWEQQALQQHGPESPQATQWAEIRADLARIAGRYTFATQLWIAATRTRLVHQDPDAVEVLNGATSAYHCWTEIKDVGEARTCGPELVNLLRQLPPLQRYLTTAQQRLEFLHGC